MNHYCPGLVKLNRAKKLFGSKTKGTKRQLLNAAKGDAILHLEFHERLSRMRYPVARRNDTCGDKCVTRDD